MVTRAVAIEGVWLQGTAPLKGDEDATSQSPSGDQTTTHTPAVAGQLVDQITVG